MEMSAERGGRGPVVLGGDAGATVDFGTLALSQSFVRLTVGAESLLFGTEGKLIEHPRCRLAPSARFLAPGLPGT